MADRSAATESTQDAFATQDASGPFVHRWNELVSVTNWEKGRIIGEWRTALEAAGAGVSEYSDEAWAERVGNVTGQHVGRLRRTHERFGAVHGDYPGLYWSHFQVALDWDDAEMWLEGAVQNRWSVSQMRAKRWETLGAPASLKPRDEDVIVAEMDEDAGERFADNADEDEFASPRIAPVGEASENGHAASSDIDDRGDSDDADDSGVATAPSPRMRPFENLPALPDDVAEAFEGFKLVILTHKMTGWTEIARDDLLACLDALKALALQPGEE